MRYALSLVLVLSVSACGSSDTEPSPVHPPPAAAPEVAPEPVVSPAPAAPRGMPLAIRRGTGFTCVLRDGGRVACWGRNAEGQLGQEHRDAVEGVVHVRGLEDAVALAVSVETACALRRTGQVVCWGGNRSGGLGVNFEQRGLVQVPGIRGMQGLDAGGGRFYVWGEDGVVYAWGLSHLRVDEDVQPGDPRTGPRRTRLRGIVRIESGSETFALHGEGRATVWGTGHAALDTLSDVRDVAASSGGTCVQDGAGVVRCVLHTGHGTEERVAESLEGAESLVFAGNGLVVGLRQGRLVALSYYAGGTSRFADAEDLVGLAKGSDPGVMAITRDGRILAWGGRPQDGEYVPTQIALPAADEDAPAPPLPEGPMPRHCRVEVQRIAAPAPITAERALVLALAEEGTDELGPESLCGSMRTAFGSSDCPAAGPWVALTSVTGTVSVVQPLPEGRARLLWSVASDWSGTEAFNTLEHWALRSADPLALAMITSRGEPTDDDEPGAAPGEVARAATVILQTPQGDFVQVTAHVDLARMRRAGAYVNRIPTARLADGRVELWACDGHGTYPIPATATHAFDAPSDADAPVAGAGEPAAPGVTTTTTGVAPTGATPSTEAIAAAREQCSEGFRALGQGDLDAARSQIDAALAVLSRATDVSSVRSFGACLYNRGRLAELDSDTSAARGFYERSLAARPNPTVQARLASLAP